MMGYESYETFVLGPLRAYLKGRCHDAMVLTRPMESLLDHMPDESQLLWPQKGTFDFRTQFWAPNLAHGGTNTSVDVVQYRVNRLNHLLLMTGPIPTGIRYLLQIHIDSHLEAVRCIENGQTGDVLQAAMRAPVDPFRGYPTEQAQPHEVALFCEELLPDLGPEVFNGTFGLEAGTSKLVTLISKCIPQKSCYMRQLAFKIGELCSECDYTRDVVARLIMCSLLGNYHHSNWRLSFRERVSLYSRWVNGFREDLPRLLMQGGEDYLVYNIVREYITVIVALIPSVQRHMDMLPRWTRLQSGVQIAMDVSRELLPACKASESWSQRVVPPCTICPPEINVNLKKLNKRISGTRPPTAAAARKGQQATSADVDVNCTNWQRAEVALLALLPCTEEPGASRPGPPYASTYTFLDHAPFVGGQASVQRIEAAVLGREPVGDEGVTVCPPQDVRYALDYVRLRASSPAILVHHIGTDLRKLQEAAVVRRLVEAHLIRPDAAPAPTPAGARGGRKHGAGTTRKPPSIIRHAETALFVCPRCKIVKNALQQPDGARMDRVGFSEVTQCVFDPLTFWCASRSTVCAGSPLVVIDLLPPPSAEGESSVVVAEVFGAMYILSPCCGDICDMRMLLADTAGRWRCPRCMLREEPSGTGPSKLPKRCDMCMRRFNMGAAAGPTVKAWRTDGQMKRICVKCAENTQTTPEKRENLR